MKTYIQITAGRGPVECARVAALVAKEIVGAIPSLQLIDSEPHHNYDDCYMSLTFASEHPISDVVVKEWQGSVLWRSTKIHIDQITNVATGLWVSNSLMRSNCPK